MIDDRCDNVGKIFDLEGFGYGSLEAVFFEILHGCAVGVAGGEDSLHVWIDSRESEDGFISSGASWNGEIEDDCVERSPMAQGINVQINGLIAVACQLYLIANLLEHLAGNISDELFVVHEQEACPCLWRRS